MLLGGEQRFILFGRNSDFCTKNADLQDHATYLSFQRLNESLDFHEKWNRHYAIGGHSKLLSDGRFLRNLV